MIPDGVEARLRAHVASTIDAAQVPGAVRDDLAEEFYGHLAERWHELVANGMEPMDATSRAIRDFGHSRRIGQDLTHAYRGRFWASTIGVLLPATTTTLNSPRIAWWLGASLRFYGVVLALLVVGAAANLSPIRAILVMATGVPAVAILFIAAVAIGRRQRWAAELAVVVNVVGLLFGAWEMLSTPNLLSVNVIVSGILLIAAYHERAKLARWVRRSRSIPTRLSVPLLAAAVGGFILPGAAAGLPDPFQAGPDDLHITASMACRETPTRGGAVTVELRWDHTSVLPGGLANLSDFGDNLVLELNPTIAAPSNYPFLTDRDTGVRVAEPNMLQPAAEHLMLRDDLTGPGVIGIEQGRLEAGRTYRLTWEFDVFGDAALSELQAGVEYWHVDRFRTETLLDCNGTVVDWFGADRR
jgi:hypothetical protein